MSNHLRLAAVMSAVFSIVATTAWGQSLSLRVGLDTGKAELVNTSDTELVFDGYTIFSEAGDLNGEWTSLQDQGLPGWDEAGNTDNRRLTEFNPLSSAVLAGGQALSVGNVFAPAEPGVLGQDTGLLFQYTQPSGEVVDGIIDGLAALSLSVDRGTGAVELSNTFTEAVSLDAYTISSPGGHLKGEWFSLQDQSVSGWDEADNSGNLRLTEFNPTSSTEVASGQTIGLGTPFSAPEPPSAIGELIPEDITFEYSAPNGRILSGVVGYEGPLNNVVLTIDATSGSATIQNQSSFFDVSIDGYTITSAAGVLNPETWNSLQDQGIAAWDEADNADAFRLTEFNPTSASQLEGGGTILDIGSAFDASKGISVDDLNFEFLVAAGDVRQGLIVIGTGPSCVIPAGGLPGDLDGNGTVAFADFLVLSTNFNQAVSTYEEGDIDCSGEVGFADFLVLSANFGSSAAATANTVPEPHSAVLTILAGGLLCLLRKRRGS